MTLQFCSVLHIALYPTASVIEAEHLVSLILLTCKVCQTKEINVGIRSNQVTQTPFLRSVEEQCAASNSTVFHVFHRQPSEHREEESIIHLLPEDTKESCFLLSDHHGHVSQSGLEMELLQKEVDS